LSKAGIELNRKMLSEIAIHDAEGFASLAKIAKSKATIAAKKAK
jgi:large subunit ribosomal protein L20